MYGLARWQERLAGRVPQLSAQHMGLRMCACGGLCRDPTRLNLSPFRSLQHLELVGCDVSTSAWLGLAAVRLTLRSLACHDSLEELWHLLAPSLGRPTTESAPRPDQFPCVCPAHIPVNLLLRTQQASCRHCRQPVMRHEHQASLSLPTAAHMQNHFLIVLGLIRFGMGCTGNPRTCNGNACSRLAWRPRCYIH